jgi:hypothetical protein
MEILKQMEDAGVESNEYTLHNILTACGRVGPRDRENALSTLTGTLGKIRVLGLVEAKAYPWAFPPQARLTTVFFSNCSISKSGNPNRPTWRHMIPT